MALGEVTTEDIQDLMESANLQDFDFFDGTFKEGRLRFDTALLYRKRMFQILDAKSIITHKGPRSMKVANRIDFLVSETERPFHVFVAHWPSRLHCPKNGSDRNLLGIRLKDSVEELFESNDGPVHTIILGDFNDEPFDASLSEYLLATRDRKLVRKDSRFLYNPFWRLLGEAVPHVPGVERRSYSGSYFHKSGTDTQWRTFDQIIFSSAFLGPSDWQLNEKFTKILQFHPFDQLVCKSNEIFDHFPVISVIEREEKHGRL